MLSPRFLLPLSLSVLLVCSTLPVVRAGTIELEQSDLDTFGVIQAYGPFGQSFIAESDTLLKFEFFLQAFNPTFPNTPLTLSILEGEGLGGTTLTSQSLLVPESTYGFTGASFSLGITAGNTYTAVLSSTSFYWAASGSFTDVYSDGQAYSSSYFGYKIPFEDMTFRAVFAAPVPAGTHTIILSFMGLVLIATGHRLRRS